MLPLWAVYAPRLALLAILAALTLFDWKKEATSRELLRIKDRIIETQRQHIELLERHPSPAAIAVPAAIDFVPVSRKEPR